MVRAFGIGGSVDSALVGVKGSDRGHAYSNARREGSELLQTLEALELAFGKPDPPQQGLARIGVDANVAQKTTAARKSAGSGSPPRRWGMGAREKSIAPPF